MIKCDVKITGAVYSVPVSRTDKNGKPYAQFSLVTVLAGKDGTTVKQEITVFTDPTADIMSLASGVRIGVKGELSFKKRGDHMHFNLSKAALDQADTTDSIVGTTVFQGRIGTDITLKEDRNHKPFIIFRGYCTEKVNDNFEFIWLQFIGFGMNIEPWMQKKAPCEITGSIEISCFKERVSLSCRMSTIKEHVFQAQGE